jgi:nucleoside-diphosphate-sugar epimerase
MAQTAFITGGSGFIGGALIRRLTDEGWSVRALARSDRSADAVRELGADPASGDLEDVAAMRAGAEGADVSFHAAASLGDWGTRQYFEQANVQGTRNALQASREAGVARFVHVGTEAAVTDGKPLVRIDESKPLTPHSKALYCATKAQAEQAVRDSEGIDWVVIRPRLVWGPGDNTILPALAEAMRAGRFAWIGGGGHLTSTTHVDNVVEGLMLGAEKAKPGSVYFVTDGEPVVFKEFITALVATAGVEAPSRSLPAGLAKAVAAGSEGLWRTLRLKGAPPLTRLAVWLSSMECTIDDSRAREQLGYREVKTREQGLAELAAS